MTEDEIERRVEKYVNNLDRRYMSNQGMTKKDYDREMADLTAWADAKREENERIEKQKKQDEARGVPLGWTGAQVRALRELFDRQPLIMTYGETSVVRMPRRAENYTAGFAPLMTYEDFAKLAHLSFGALMVPWCGMWIGIEPDGYTHS